MPGTSTVKAAWPRPEWRAVRVRHEGSGGFCGAPGRPSLLTLALLTLSLSVPPAPSASCPGRNCSCTRLSSTAGRSSLCVRSAATGRPAETACRCTSRPSTGGGGPSSPRAWPCCCLQARGWAGKAEFAAAHPECPHPESGACSLPGWGRLPGEQACWASEAGGRGFQARPGSLPPPRAASQFPVAPGMELVLLSQPCPSPSSRQLAAARARSQGSSQLASALPVSVAWAGRVPSCSGA